MGSIPMLTAKTSIITKYRKIPVFSKTAYLGVDMKMRDAVLAAEIGDSIKKIDTGYTIEIGSGDPSSVPWHPAISDQWQVIKAEPKVLTAEEMYEKYYHEEYKKRKECPVFDSTDIIKFGYVMDKNGQLKEWNRTKELMDAVWDVMVEHKDNRNANMKNLFRAYSKHHNPCQ